MKRQWSYWNMTQWDLQPMIKIRLNLMMIIIWMMVYSMYMFLSDWCNLEGEEECSHTDIDLIETHTVGVQKYSSSMLLLQKWNWVPCVGEIEREEWWDSYRHLESVECIDLVFGACELEAYGRRDGGGGLDSWITISPGCWYRWVADCIYLCMIGKRKSTSKWQTCLITRIFRSRWNLKR